MKATRYQTDQRLWLAIALILFLASWWFPLIGIKGEAWKPAALLWALMTSIFHADISFREFVGIGGSLLIFACFSCFIAMAFGWFLQCLVVIVRTRIQERKKHAS